MGLPLALVLAEVGHHVVAIDTDSERVISIKRGHSPFEEPGVSQLLEVMLKCGRFSIEGDYHQVPQCEVVVVVVGTDLDQNERPQRDSVLNVASRLREVASPSTTIILRSTVTPGTTSLVHEQLGKHVREVVFCPERIAEGHALEELRKIPQVIGTMDGQASLKASQLFSSIGIKCHTLTWREAELGKLLLNSWRYLQFATANEFARVCESYDVSYQSLLRVITEDYSRASGLMKPGLAGGPCLRKDTLQLLAGLSISYPVLDNVLNSHDVAIHSIVNAAQTTVHSPKSAVVQLGLTFKPESDDLRGSAALVLARKLSLCFENFFVVEPHVSDSSEFNLITLAKAQEIAEVVVVGTKHRCFVDGQFGVPIVDIGGSRLINSDGRVA